MIYLDNIDEIRKKFLDTPPLGYSKEENALAEDMEVFYPIESQEKYGVVGIEIALIKSL